MHGTLFIVWTMLGAASLTLAAVHGLIWLLDRRRLASLSFTVVALSVSAIAAIEFALMGAASPAEYASLVRLLHPPMFFLVAGIVFFVRLYLGTGRRWLGWTVIGLRGAITLANVSGVGVTWQVTGLERLPFLGQLATTSGEAALRPAQWLATAATVLLIAYVFDAALALARRPEREARRRAWIVGGGIGAFVLIATVQSQLVVWGLVRMPIMLSPPFLIMLAAITYELCRDIVASARIEREARRLRDELAHVARVNTMGELSGALAHELNQPLGAILRNAEAAKIMLERPAPDIEELRAIVGDIRADDQRAAAIIERMRALLKRKSLELHAVPLQSLVHEVLALVKSDAAARRVTLDCAVPEDLPPVSADRVQVSQVLLNLLVNGIDAVSDSKAGERRVAIDARRADERTVEVTVADSGHGIAPDVLPRVFDPFVTTKAKGLGIGLAVSRTIVEAHGGRLWAQNNPQAGASFRFTLPVAAAGA
jgi:C4-dicarboxylate-specific signal transduction histidine kinase